jgi:hypothetical protein
MKRFCIVLSVLFCIVFSLSAQQRGGDNEEGAIEIIDARRAVTVVGKQWAVFIAVDDYREWGQLEYPVKDAQEIKNILLEYYNIDEIRELYNRQATASAIRRLFIELQDKTGPNDSVFVFHAGHGINEDRTRTPAWIPYDGGEDIYTQANWLTHLQIRSMLDSLRAKHVFLISDSCFSGDLLDATRGTTETVINYPTAYDRVSRQAMSSGASEAVVDESEFASRLKSTLLRTETPYITPDYLLSQIKEVQTTRPLSTIPILAAIPRSGHQIGGSFLFFRKNPRQNVTVITAPAQETIPETITPPAVVTEQTPTIQGLPGEYAYFIGSWIATVENNMSYDTYQINLSANGRCTVKLTNDIAEQETIGNWSWDGSMFRLNAVFRNGAIAYQQNIQWVSIVNFGGGNNAFNILGRATTNGSPVRFTFFRD